MNIADVAGAEEASLTPIQRLYHERVVLITGGTGFMGKALTLKLLTACPTIGQIYYIVRPKKGKNVHQRLDEIFDDPLFDSLKETKVRLKAEALEGDCGAPGLGLSDQDRARLARDCHVVIHAAATVRFDERLPLAVDINVRGTHQMLELAREMPNLKAFVHVSTAFANCHLPQIKEQFYPPPTPAERLQQLVSAADPQLIDNITPQILGEWPNTYVYTKSVAEDMVLRHSKNLPVAVFRPAIVVATAEGPAKGWIDNLYGATGVVVGCGTGVLRSLQCDSQVPAQIVPVDMACNAILAATWHISQRSNEDSNHNVAKEGAGTRTPEVFNFTTNPDNQINWERFLALCFNYGYKAPPLQTMWYICLTLHSSWFMHKMSVVFLHFLPAILVDLVAMLFGKRTNMLKIYKKINKFSDVIAYFGTRQWDFGTERTRALWDSLDPRDRQLFFFDMSQLDWDSYFESYCQGIRLYLLKEDPSTVPAALTRLRRFYWAHQSLKAVLIFAGLRLAWSVSNMVMSSIS